MNIKHEKENTSMRKRLERKKERKNIKTKSKERITNMNERKKERKKERKNIKTKSKERITNMKKKKR